MKKREIENLLAERDSEISVLARKIATLEAEIKGYKDREASIVAAMTQATETRDAIISQAQRDAELAVNNANRTADGILTDARAKANEMIDRADTYAASQRKTYADINAHLTQVAEELRQYVKEAAPEFYRPDEVDDSELGESFSAGAANDVDSGIDDTVDSISDTIIPTPEPETKPEPTPAKTYRSPADFFHAIMAIEGRSADTDSDAAEACVEDETAPVDEPTETLEEEIVFTPFESGLLSTDEIEGSTGKSSGLSGDKKADDELMKLVSEVIDD